VLSFRNRDLGETPRVSTGEGFIDPVALERSLAGLGDRTSGIILSRALHDAIDTTRELFSADGAGVMMVDDSTVLCAVAATNESARILEERQERIGCGPCVDALTFDRTVATADLMSDDRWPELGAEMADAGVCSVLGVPIRAGGLPVGSLNVYRGHRGEWNNTEVSAIEAYGGLIDGLLLAALQAHANEQIVKQLQRALDNRVVIERAVGVIMEREKADAVAAFGRLRQEARATQRKAAEVAAAILAGIEPHSEEQT
jgi:GAF domain-containing protein